MFIKQFFRHYFSSIDIKGTRRELSIFFNYALKKENKKKTKKLERSAEKHLYVKI